MKRKERTKNVAKENKKGREDDNNTKTQVT